MNPNKLNLTQEELRIIFEKGAEIPRFDPSVHRTDCTPQKKHITYKNYNSPYPLNDRWEVDYIDPSLPPEEINDISNLQPVQWEFNAAYDVDLKTRKPRDIN